MDKRRLIILSDYGLDDACALVYLLNFADRFDGIDVVCVAGNAPASASLINAQKLRDHYEGKTNNVRLVSTNAVPQKYAALPSIHGVDGMGDLFAAPQKIDAIPYAEWMRSLHDGAIVLSLGPCPITLDILTHVKAHKLILMAGMVKETPNHLGMEFNQALDPDSYNACLTYPHAVATLDTCRAKNFNLAACRFMGDRLLYRLVNRAAELAEARHPDNCYIYDLIAALYWIEPDIFDARTVIDPWGNALTELKAKVGSFSLAEYLEKLF